MSADAYGGIRPEFVRLVEAAEARVQLGVEPTRPDKHEKWIAVIVEFVTATEEARKVLDGR